MNKNYLRIDNPTIDDAFSENVLNHDFVKCKLTPKQDFIINCLQNGWVLITSSQSSTIWCGNNDNQFEFSSSLFWRLFNYGFIYQEKKWPFNYVLTELGKKLITRKVKYGK